MGGIVSESEGVVMLKFRVGNMAIRIITDSPAYQTAQDSIMLQISRR